MEAKEWYLSEDFDAETAIFEAILEILEEILRWTN